jgi:hypothetical protein
MCSRFSRVISLGLALAVASCDSWPTSFKNVGKKTVSFEYLHKDYHEWSAWASYRPGVSTFLASGHYFKDILGIRVHDGGHVFQINDKGMAAFRKVFNGQSGCEIA